MKNSSCCKTHEDNMENNFITVSSSVWSLQSEIISKNFNSEMCFTFRAAEVKLRLTWEEEEEQHRSAAQRLHPAAIRSIPIGNNTVMTDPLHPTAEQRGGNALRETAAAAACQCVRCGARSCRRRH